MQKHNISFTNGNDKGNYYLFLTYLDNNGIVRGKAEVYNRLTAAINSEYQIKPWIKVGTTNQVEKYSVRNVSTNNEYGSLLTSILMLDPLTPDTYTYEDLPSNMLNALNSGKHLLQNGNGDYFAVSKFYAGEQCEQYHPMIMRDNNIGKSSGFNINGSIYADFNPIEGFTYTSRLGYRLSGTPQFGTDLPFYGNSVQSRDYVSHNTTSTTNIYYQWENFANYTHTFGNHTITGMAGMSYQESTSEYVYGSLSANDEDALKKNYPLFYFPNYGSASATKGVAGEKLRSAKYSYFGRIGYEYDNRYMIQASLRADAADLALLPSTNRWGYFPAVSAGWTISEETFFEPVKKQISSFKLRASWGQNGSLAALENYPYSTDTALGNVFPFVLGSKYVAGVSSFTMGNDKLKWKTSEQINIGIDSRFLNDRLTFSLDYFEKKSKDLLVTGTTPSLIIGGITSPMNAGNVTNKGWEFELGWRDNIGDFTYAIRGNLATLKNKVTYIDPSITRLSGVNFHSSTITYFEQGYPGYYFRGYKFKGVDPETGDPAFHDLDESGGLNDGDLDYIGDAIPDFTYGITLTAVWKGIDLTIFGTGSQDNDIFNCINKPDNPASNKLKEVFYDNRWTATNTAGTIPRAGANNMDKYQVSDALVYDGSLFKIKQMQIGYTFPKKWMKKAFFSNLGIYGSLDDFFTFTKYPGWGTPSKVVTDSIYSKVLETHRAYTIYLPKSYDTETTRKYPILYLLHGMGGTNTSWFEGRCAKDVMDRLVASGETCEMIIVTPNAGGDFAQGAWNGCYNMPGWYYEDFFYQEFLPYIESTYRVTGNKQNRALAGLSVGANGATGYAQRYSDMYCAVYAISSGMTLPDMPAPPGLTADGKEKMAQLIRSVQQHNCITYVAEANDIQKRQLRTIKWFIDCGDDDFLLYTNIDFFRAMRASHIPCQFCVRDGGHDNEYWHSGLYLILPFVSRNFGK